VGAPGGVAVAPYHGLFATIRSVNQGFPKDRRLRVLCGDPPIDWTGVETRDDIAHSWASATSTTPARSVITSSPYVGKRC
jgi:hypothetical protein